MGYERQADFGTPEVRSDQEVTCSIDGREVRVPAGTTVMRAAALTGGSIPKLCATDNLKQFGSCRLCLVEIDGMRGTPASCTTPVAEGMKVHTQTPRLQKLRKGVMELYISDHPLDCLTCSANNDCELQDQAAAVGLRDVRFGYEGENHLSQPTDTSNPYFDFDPSKCAPAMKCRGRLHSPFRGAGSNRRFRQASPRTASSRPNAYRAGPVCRLAPRPLCRKRR
jgi:formate dehydrogenase major subunit